MIVSPLARHVVEAANTEPRRSGRAVDMLLLHYTGMASAAAARDLLCSPQSGVSCHYLVDEDGAITQMVGEELRAWHAGVSSWQGETDTNSRSIGIEIQNPGHGAGYPDFPPKQMEAVAALSKDIVARHNILPQHVLAHSDIAPERKIDPGEKFDWRYLHAQGVGHWVAPVEVSGGVFLQQGDRGDPVLALQGMFSLYGYRIVKNGQYDAQTRLVVEAFQRHFRPSRVDGIADHSTVATLHALLQARPAVA